jgi:type IV pilus assembly protein PilO
MVAKLVFVIIVCGGLLGLGYFFDTQDQMTQLQATQSKEDKLKQQFEAKQAVAGNLEAYRQQMKEMERTFGTLLLKLPGQTEVPELLVDVNRVGMDSGLKFELFKPGTEVLKDFYAESPIDIQVVGSYHQFGEFASGVAALPRIVTLHDLSIHKGKDGLLTMKAVANTYRYLEKDEINKSKKKGKRKRKR